MYVMGLSKGVEAVRQSIAEGILPNNTLGFIPTAGDTNENPYFVGESRKRLENLGLHIIELDVANASIETLQHSLDKVDGVYVAGGNTFYLSYQMQQKGLQKELSQRVRQGFPYFGESAGAVYLAESIEPAKPLDDPADAPLLENHSGLGLVDFFILPHVNNEKYQTVFTKFLNDNEGKLKIVKIRDDQAALTRDGTTYEILSSPIAELS